LRISPPRKNSVPRLERLGITSVKPGSRPHHWRSSSRAAAVHRVWPVTMQITSPRCTCAPTASARDERGSGTRSDARRVRRSRGVEHEVGETSPLLALVAEHDVVLLRALVVEVRVAVPG